MEYHISCRVRSTICGIDAEINEHADLVVEAIWATDALGVWLTTTGWLRLTPEALESLMAMGLQELRTTRWDSHDDGKSKGHMDWETEDLEYDEEAHTLSMSGTANLGEFEFQVLITTNKAMSEELRLHRVWRNSTTGSQS